MNDCNMTNSYPCTFEDCQHVFKSEKQLKRHKCSEPDHNYCDRCDLDFGSEEALLIHKIKSSDHIVCAMCGSEFRSEGGRDSHTRQVCLYGLSLVSFSFAIRSFGTEALVLTYSCILQLHFTEQNIECIGCGTVFNRAQGLMAHIEGNHCKGLTMQKYNEHRYNKQITEGIFHKALQQDRSIAPPTDTGSDDGGVGLNLMDIDEEGNQGDSETGLLRDKTNSATPAVFDDLGRLVGRSHHPIDGDLMGFSEIPSTDRITVDNYGTNRLEECSSMKHIENEMPSKWEAHLPYQPGSAISNRPINTPPATSVNEEEKFAGLSNTNWDPLKYFNPSVGNFLCLCNEQFDTAKELEKHFLSGIHAGGVVR